MWFGVAEAMLTILYATMKKLKPERYRTDVELCER